MVLVFENRILGRWTMVRWWVPIWLKNVLLMNAIMARDYILYNIGTGQLSIDDPG